MSNSNTLEPRSNHLKLAHMSEAALPLMGPGQVLKKQFQQMCDRPFTQAA